MNLSNSTDRKYENAMPAIDEGWWESVLAEEQRQYNVPRKAKPALQQKAEIQLNENQAQAEPEASKNSSISEHAQTTLQKSDRRAELLHSLQAGVHLKGTVTSITDFGAFVDLGGLEGLIHISELSWGRVPHPNQIVRLGEEIEVQVLEISKERNRVALSLKRMSPNPWENAEAEFAIDTIQSAVVSSVLSYGAFARLKPGIEGLIHISKMPLLDGQTPRDILTEGQEVQVRVLYIDPAHQRMGLRLQTNR
ncbi:MAG: S1 RNA-binding domain-containing protein [Anaerolineae bacterium]|nr:S1 RNA-binding domain-containing protein [Anaerolineae bacterium]MCI0610278.1 S1 RNA-binding domain-containing protein [Anaerolineae bacterium]